MCIICVQFELGKLTRTEALNALPELIASEQLDLEHAQDLYDELLKDVVE